MHTNKLVRNEFKMQGKYIRNILSTYFTQLIYVLPTNYMY